MRQFIAGVAAGVLLSVGFVYWGWKPPAVLNIPKMLRGNLVSTSVENVLYDFDAGPDERQRALEVFLENRAEFAAKVDSEQGHPFITALRRQRAVREARQLMSVLAAHQQTLNQPALRAALERKYNTSETEPLLKQMSSDALGEKPFLKSWLQNEALAIDPSALSATLARVADATRLDGND